MENGNQVAHSVSFYANFLDLRDRLELNTKTIVSCEMRRVQNTEVLRDNFVDFKLSRSTFKQGWHDRFFFRFLAKT
jgi:hypothetical protein